MLIIAFSVMSYGQDIIVDANWGNLDSGITVSGNYVVGVTAFASIGKALNALTQRKDSSATVQVNAGEYANSDTDNFVYINIPVRLKGAGKGLSIIRGHIVTIAAAPVTISGFSIFVPFGAEGINVDAEDSVFIENNEISAPYSSIGCMHLNPTKAVIRGNDLHGSQIGISNVSGLITGNDIHDNEKWGLVDVGGIVENNRIYGNGEEGVNIQHRSALLRNNLIYKNGKSGIMTLNESVAIFGNVIYRNGGDGIGLYGCNDQIINNTIVANKSHGIRRGEYAGMTAINNIIFSNDSMGIGAARPDQSSTSLISYNDVFCNKAGNYYDTAILGAGNKSSNPVFVNDSDDFRLQNASPCIGAGIPVDGRSLDVNGASVPTPRCTDPDMGAYENSSGTPQNGPLFKASVPALSFDGVPLGENASRRLTIRNVADDALAGASFSVTGTVFAVKTVSGSLKMCDSLIISVVFTPKEVRSCAETLFVDRPNSVQGHLKIPLWGFGTKFDLMPSAFHHDFGKILVGSSSQWLLRLFNGDSQSVRSVALTSTREAFAFSPESVSIAPLDSIFIEVSFTAPDTSTCKGAIDVVDKTIFDRIFSISLSGTGKAPPTGTHGEGKSVFPVLCGMDANHNLRVRCSKEGAVSITLYQMDGKQSGSTVSRLLSVGDNLIPMHSFSAKTSPSIFFMVLRWQNGQKTILKEMML